MITHSKIVTAVKVIKEWSIQKIKLNALSSLSRRQHFTDMGISGLPKVIKATGGILAHSLKDKFVHVDLLSLFFPLIQSTCFRVLSSNIKKERDDMATGRTAAFSLPLPPQPPPPISTFPSPSLFVPSQGLFPPPSFTTNPQSQFGFDTQPATFPVDCSYTSQFVPSQGFVPQDAAFLPLGMADQLNHYGFNPTAAFPVDYSYMGQSALSQGFAPQDPSFLPIATTDQQNHYGFNPQPGTLPFDYGYTSQFVPSQGFAPQDPAFLPIATTDQQNHYGFNPQPGTLPFDYATNQFVPSHGFVPQSAACLHLATTDPQSQFGFNLEPGTLPLDYGYMGQSAPSQDFFPQGPSFLPIAMEDQLNQHGFEPQPATFAIDYSYMGQSAPSQDFIAQGPSLLPLALTDPPLQVPCNMNQQAPDHPTPQTVPSRNRKELQGSHAQQKRTMITQSQKKLQESTASPATPSRKRAAQDKDLQASSSKHSKAAQNVLSDIQNHMNHSALFMGLDGHITPCTPEQNPQVR